MRFSDKREEFVRTVETICLFVSLGAIFFQIWVLISSLESSFKGNVPALLPGVVLSGLAFMVCGGSALLTNIDFLEGIRGGRTKSYQEKSDRNEGGFDDKN